MNRKERWYAVISGCVGAALTMVVCSFLPIGVADNIISLGDGPAYLGAITCSSVTVRSPDGSSGVVLRTIPEGGDIVVYGKRGSGRVLIGINENGGRIAVTGKGSGEHRGLVYLQHDENGGLLGVTAKGSPGARASIGVIGNGDGQITTWDKNGKRLK